jgi:hypothetical protein
LLIEKLEALHADRIRRLMVFMPPGSAKSTYSSVLFPAFGRQRWKRSASTAARTTPSPQTAASVWALGSVLIWQLLMTRSGRAKMPTAKPSATKSGNGTKPILPLVYDRERESS